jgi:hypothetical protein
MVRRFDDLDELVNAAPNLRLVGPVLDVAGGARRVDHVLDRLRSPAPAVARRLR